MARFTALRQQAVAGSLPPLPPSQENQEGRRRFEGAGTTRRFQPLANNYRSSRFSETRKNFGSREEEKEDDPSLLSRMYTRTTKTVGGAIGAVGRVLQVGSNIQVGLTEELLERNGVLEKDDDSFIEEAKTSIREQKSNIGLLEKIGQQRKQYEPSPNVSENIKEELIRAAIGKYEPTQSVWGNFVQEIPHVGIGLAADIFLDPLLVLSKVGVVKKGFTGVGKGATAVGKVVVNRIPATQKVADMVGRSIVNRYGQRALFTDIDKARKVEESLAYDSVARLVSPVIDKPRAIQQRVASVIKGGITTDDDVKALAEPIREEFDRLGKTISDVNPKLLNPEVFEKNKGRYFPRLYSKYEFPKGEEEFISELFTKQRAVSIPRERFRRRLTDFQFAKQVDPNVINVEKEVQKIETRFEKAVTGRREKIEFNKEEVAGLADDIHKTFTENITGELKTALQDQQVDLARGNIQQFASVLRDRAQLRPLDIKKMIKTNEARKAAGTAKEYTAEDIAEIKKALQSQVDALPEETKIVDELLGLVKVTPAKEIKAGVKIKVPEEVEKLLARAKGLKKQYIQENLTDDITAKFVNDVADEFEKNPVAVSALLNRIKTREGRVDKLLDQIIEIKRDRLEKLRLLPSKKEVSRLAEEARAELGEIREAGYPAAKGLTQLKNVEIRQQFFKQVSEIASDAPKPGWIQMSDDKALGDLAGKFLPAAEYRAIASLRRIPTKAEEIYLKALRLWKAGKTAYNPATIARNDLTNFFILNPLGGVGFHRVDLYAQATHELITKGDYFQMFRQAGGLMSSQEAAELVNKSRKLYTKHGYIREFFKTPAKFHQMVVSHYGSHDRFFKLANFIKGVGEDGLTPQQAMKRANEYLVDYSEVPELVEWLRKTPLGVPFISFAYGVSIPLAKTLVTRPDKLANYFKVMSAVQSMNPGGESKQALEQEKDVLPEWISHGAFLRLPVQDKHGRSQYVDLQYILPFNIIESKSITPSSPAFKLLAEVLTNTDSFTGQPITKDTDTSDEKTEKWTLHIARGLLPSLTPFVGYSYDKIKNAYQGRPDKHGFVKTKWEVLFDVLGGIKVTPIDPTIEAQKRAYEKKRDIDEIRSNMRRIMLDKTIFPEEKQVQIIEQRTKLQRRARQQ